jgi:glycerol uptake facilitator-like aquaporin
VFDREEHHEEWRPARQPDVCLEPRVAELTIDAGHDREHAPGHVGGNHINPAVTVGLAVSGKFPWSQVPGYIAAQVVGAIVGATAIIGVLGHKASDVGLGVASYTGISWTQAFTAEFVGTFILVFTIFGVIHRKAAAGFAGVAIGLVVFAAIDWVMSLEPQWYSTIYGLLFMVSQALTAMAFSIAILTWLSDRKPLSQVVRPAQFQDLGSFLLTFVMLWAYLEFSQFLIIWGGNLSEEIPWYLRRMEGVWGNVGLLLVILSFFFPFFLLLFRHVKTRKRSLLIVALLVLVMRLVDMYWMVLPAFGGGKMRLTWMNVALPFGMGGIWFAYFLWQLQRMPILPVHDPRMEEIAGQAVEHG